MIAVKMVAEHFSGQYCALEITLDIEAALQRDPFAATLNQKVGRDRALAKVHGIVDVRLIELLGDGALEEN